MDEWFKKEEPIPCPPDMKELENLLDEFDPDEQADEIERAKEAMNCLETTLILYNLFTTSPNEKVINEMYKRTKELLDSAYNTRRIQEDKVWEQYNELEEQYYQSGCNKYSEKPLINGELPKNYTKMSRKCKFVVDIMLEGKRVLEQFKEDYEQLDTLKEKCQHVHSKQDKVLCVESFVHAAHTRGPYLPTGCGFILPEDLMPRDYEFFPFENLGATAERITEDTLDCLAGK